MALLAGSLPMGLTGAEVILLQESFETDGAGTRYTVQGGGDSGSNDYFARRQLGSTGTRVRGNIDGDWMWSIRDIDQVGEDPPLDNLEPDEGRIIWNEVFDISNLGNFRIDVLAAQGSDDTEFDNVITFEVRIDGGEWQTVGGWRGLHTQSPRYFFEGGIGTIPQLGGPRLTQLFRDWTIDVFGTGDTLELRMFTNNNGGSEEGHIDNVRLIAEDSLQQFTLGLNRETYQELNGIGAGELIVTLPSPAPNGGLPLRLSIPEINSEEADIRSSVSVPSGEQTVRIPFDILNDGVFDGDEEVTINVEADGFARDFVTFTVENAATDPRPDVVINEFLPFLDDISGDNFQFDVNNDGFVAEDNDQFIEIVNKEDRAIDISGWTVNDELAVRHIFPQGTILGPAGTPESVLVVFAVGVAEPDGVFGGAQIQEFSFFSPNFDEDGDVALLRADGATIDSHAYTPAVGESFSALSRNPDLTGPFADFLDIPDDVDNGRLFTIGRKVDNTTFFNFSQTASLSVANEKIQEGQTVTATLSIDGNAPAGGLSFTLENGNPQEISLPGSVTIPAGASEVQFSITAVSDSVLDGSPRVKIDARAADTFPAQVFVTAVDLQEDPFDVVVNEAMANVIGTDADINGNGVVEEPLADQFIEFVNNGDEAVDLSGWTVESWAISEPGGVQQAHTFPTGTVLASKGALVLFGRGNAEALQSASADRFGDALVQVASGHGNGVNLIVGETERITLKTPYGHVENEADIDEDNTEQRQSVTRNPDITGALEALHVNASGALLASPGTGLDGTPFAGNSERVSFFYDFIGERRANSNPIRIESLRHGAFLFPVEVDSNTGYFFDTVFGQWWFSSGLFYPWVYVFEGSNVPAGWYFYFENSHNNNGFRIFQSNASGQLITDAALR